MYSMQKFSYAHLSSMSCSRSCFLYLSRLQYLIQRRQRLDFPPRSCLATRKPCSEHYEPTAFLSMRIYTSADATAESRRSGRLPPVSTYDPILSIASAGQANLPYLALGPIAIGEDALRSAARRNVVRSDCGLFQRRAERSPVRVADRALMWPMHDRCDAGRRHFVRRARRRACLEGSASTAMLFVRSIRHCATEDRSLTCSQSCIVYVRPRCLQGASDSGTYRG